MMVSGNYPKEAAKRIWQAVNTALQGSAGPGDVTRYRKRSSDLSFRVPNMKRGDENNVVLVDWRLPEYPTMSQRAQFRVLGSFAHLTSYQRRRTELQLGYAV